MDTMTASEKQRRVAQKIAWVVTVIDCALCLYAQVYIPILFFVLIYPLRVRLYFWILQS